MAFNPRDVLRLGRWEDALDGETCDALIVDAPYSATGTHAGHNKGMAGVQPSAAKLAASGGYVRNNGQKDAPYERRSIEYDGWSPADVAAFVASWAPRTSGWFVTITSHDLAPVWADALSDAGRYVFAPLPWFAPGSRVRLAGDGPSSWTCWIVVARPRCKPYSKWGTLPGGYVVSTGSGVQRGQEAHIGGKPLRLMEALVRDYTRPGDLVCDPCAGYGTTLAAALRNGRRAIGAEMDPETHAKGQAYLRKHGRALDLFAPKPLEAQALELPWSE